MRNLFLAGLAALLATTAQAATAPLWTTSGFEQPESAAYSPANGGRIYLSNVVGDPSARDGNGYISLLSADGKLIKQKWKTGLNAPKGVAVKAGLLYVTDLDELLEIDTGNLRVLHRYKAEGAKFLNDVVVRGDTVYVSDMFTNTLWQLTGQHFRPLLKDAALQGPNGLAVINGKLVVGSWGVITEGFTTSSPGYLQVVEGGQVLPLHAPIPLGHLDGVIGDGKGGVIVSDWMTGNVFKVSDKGEVQLWLPLEPGTADIGAIPNKAVLIPNMNAGTLTAYPMP